MADAILMSGGVGGVTSDDVTATKNQVLRGYRTITTDSGDEVVEGTFPTTSDADSIEEFWYYNDHGKDSYVTRILEAAYIRYWNADRTQSWNPLIRIPRQLIKNAINYHPEFTIDTITTLNEKGQIPDRGDGAVVSYLQGREDWANRIWVLFKNGWYHRNPWDDGQGHIHEAFVYVTYEQLKNLFGIDGSKMLQGYGIAGVQGTITPRPNENMTTEIVNIGWTTPKKIGLRFPPGYYPQAGQYQPIVEVNYGDLANTLGIRADKMLNDINILGIQGNIPYWVSYTKQVISAINNEGFVWDDDTGANRGRGIVSKIANGHVIAGADWVFLPSPNLYPQNVRAGVNINGVVGTMPDYSTGRTVFNGATFDGVLVSGVAAKGFYYNDTYFAYFIENGFGYGGIYNGGMNLQMSTTTPSLRSRRIGCVLSQSINVTPFSQIVVYYRTVANIQGSPYATLETHISHASVRGQVQTGGILVDTIDVIRRGYANPISDREGQIVLNVSDINEFIFLSFGAYCNVDRNNDIFAGSVQITRIDFAN